jgi:glutamate-1-semialdehyde 2,1-aminomutase
VAELNRSRSDKLFERATGLMPGGVSSPVRSFAAVGTHPFFVESASGATIADVDGNTYVDFVQSWGALLFGHAYAPIVDAVREAARRGTSFGTPSELEVELPTQWCHSCPTSSEFDSYRPAPRRV